MPPTPTSNMPGQSSRPIIGTVPSRGSFIPAVSTLRRDALKAQSLLPAVSTLSRDALKDQSVLPAVSVLNRDAIKMASTLPAISTLNRDAVATALKVQSIAPGSTSSASNLEKVVSKMPSVIASQLPGDDVPVIIDFSPGESKSRVPSVFAPCAPASQESILVTKKDKEMAAKVAEFDALPVKEKKEAHQWVIETMSKAAGDACPDKYDWFRAEGGFQCKGFGHGATDEMLAEGNGAILTIAKSLFQNLIKESQEDDKKAWEIKASGGKVPSPKHSWGDTPMPNLWGQWDQWEGPFYYHKRAKGWYVPEAGHKLPKQ